MRKKTTLKKIDYLHSSVLCAWERLRVRSHVFAIICLRNEDWISIQKCLERTIEIMVNIQNSDKSTDLQMEKFIYLQRQSEFRRCAITYSQLSVWLTWAMTEYEKMWSQELKHHKRLEDDFVASQDVEWKELIALNMALFCRIVRLTKMFE